MPTASFGSISSLASTKSPNDGYRNASIDALAVHVDELRRSRETLRVRVREQLGVGGLDPFGHVRELVGRRVGTPLPREVHAEVVELEPEREPDGPGREVPERRVEIVAPQLVRLDHVGVAVDDPQTVSHRRRLSDLPGNATRWRVAAPGDYRPEAGA